MSEQPASTGTTKDNVRALRVFCSALMAGCVCFSVIVAFLVNIVHVSATTNDPTFARILLIVLIILSVVCLGLGTRKYNNSITTAKNSLNTLPDKLNQYRTALIIYMAMCEGPALFGIIVYFLTAAYLGLAITGVMLIAMLVKFPTVSRITNELDLGSQEQQELE